MFRREPARLPYPFGYSYLWLIMRVLALGDFGFYLAFWRHIVYILLIQNLNRAFLEISVSVTLKLSLRSTQSKSL